MSARLSCNREEKILTSTRLLFGTYQILTILFVVITRHIYRKVFEIIYTHLERQVN